MDREREIIAEENRAKIVKKGLAAQKKLAGPEQKKMIKAQEALIAAEERIKELETQIETLTAPPKKDTAKKPETGKKV